jgi:aspartate racemase
MIGVLGGMGPLATADFFRKLIDATGAQRDQEHIPLLIDSVPQIPDRTAAILEGGESPLPAMLAARDRLLAAGATMIAMPCNTAHTWYDELVAGCPVPFVHIVDSVASEASARGLARAMLGLIATRGTLAAKVYETRLAAHGYRVLTPSEDEVKREVMPAIARVKAGEVEAAGRALEPVLARLLERGAQAVVLGCTETPLALDAIGSTLRARSIDSTLALARQCVRLWSERTPAPRTDVPGPSLAA